MISTPTVLVTGGAGFIGSSLAHRLLARGCRVVALDSLHPQVHAAGGRPAELPDAVELFPADVAHGPDVDAVLRLVRPDAVVHLAAETGTGQSLTEATRHGMVNVVGTTCLLDAFHRSGRLPQHIVLASSRAVYGEGMWEADGVAFAPGRRSHADLEAAQWDPAGPDGKLARPLASRAGETQTLPTSVYGATKLAQEHILAAWTAATGSRLSILRLQNVYGPGQSLTNPYTGVLSLFSQLALSHGTIDVYEDGVIVRDFVFIDDVTAAIDAALRKPPHGHRIVDIGSGSATTILDVARLLADMTGAPAPAISGRFRDGDVRAAFCDIGPARRELAWEPRVSVRDGCRALLDWVAAKAEVAS